MPQSQRCTRARQAPYWCAPDRRITN